MNPESIISPSSQPTVGTEPDVFEKQDEINMENDDPEDPSGSKHGGVLEDLPIEMISLTDRFVESLSAKVYDTPPSIDKLSDIFQEFYVRASSHVETHIFILASRLRRDASPSPNPSNSATSKPLSEQQMLTATEVVERRRARKLLQYKRQALEEAIEKRACESIYDKIWRHKTTLDEVRDEKLRSKTAALAVMGFGLKDLGVEVDTSKEDIVASEHWLENARSSLMKMNTTKCPHDKIQLLTTAHKAIVDSLTEVLPASSSADEILPTLIYALVTSPPEGINIISNLLFIQRFRAASRIDGEAAYCLTNLEAAISFLENVDLTNTDELGQGVPSPIVSKVSSCFTDPLQTKSNSQSSNVDGLSKQNNLSPISRIYTPQQEPLAGSPQHRLSSIFQPPAKALGAANDLVRNTADQGMKNISNTLDNSFKFLFGRLKEVQLKQSEGAKDLTAIVPKTLDDARRLVNSPTDFHDTVSGDDTAEKGDRIVGASNSARPKLDDRLASLVAGRKPSSDRIVKHALGPRAEIVDSTPDTSTPASLNPQGNNNSTFGSMRSFGNTLNPLNHIPGVIRGLSRSSTEPNQVIPSEQALPISARELGSVANVSPPIQRFLELEHSSQLKIGDIPELLEDYKRLASIFNSARFTNASASKN
ncbi:hypothetical protein LOZ51_006718 [Ophidiomyces ophidiicola]|nr:hypothetical protein LOZ51_006718 [Ophidiomyces ophidiicola]